MLEFRVEKTKDDRPIVTGLFDGDARIGCAWETTVCGGLFNWTLFGEGGAGIQNYGYARDGYSLEHAQRELAAAFHEHALPRTA